MSILEQGTENQVFFLPTLEMEFAEYTSSVYSYQNYQFAQ